MMMRTCYFSGLLLLAGASVLMAQQTQQNKPLEQYAQAAKDLYKHIEPTMVRIHIDHSPNAIIPSALQEEFDAWYQQRQKNKHTNKPSGHHAEKEADERETSLRRFLQQQAASSTDPEQVARIRRMLQYMNMPAAEQAVNPLGLVIHDPQKGTFVLVLMALTGDAAAKSIQITTSDGRTFSTQFAGADYLRGFSILKFTADTPLPVGVKRSVKRPQTGDLLMCVAAHSGGVGWISMPSFGITDREKPAATEEDESFIVFAQEHGPMFLFNIAGDLAAVLIDRYGVPLVNLQREMDEVISQGFVSRRSLGVKYVAIPAHSPLRENPLLGTKPAIQVQEVLPTSVAEKAGLQKNDIILSLDGKPIGQLPKILHDLSTRTGLAKVSILRNGKPMELVMELK